MATNYSRYGWETNHDTANGIMTHTFNQRVQVVANIKKGEAQLIVDGNIIETYHNMPVRKYECLLLAVEEYANGLLDRNINKRLQKAAVAKLAAKAGYYGLITIIMLAGIYLCGESDTMPLGLFALHKFAALAVIALCVLTIKHTPALAAQHNTIIR